MDPLKPAVTLGIFPAYTNGYCVPFKSNVLIVTPCHKYIYKKLYSSS